jgi:hypothetical protein
MIIKNGDCIRIALNPDMLPQSLTDLAANFRPDYAQTRCLLSWIATRNWPATPRNFLFTVPFTPSAIGAAERRRSSGRISTRRVLFAMLAVESKIFTGNGKRRILDHPRASATRCFSPPLSWTGNFCNRCSIFNLLATLCTCSRVRFLSFLARARG